MMRTIKQRGFTLIELLVVIAIIGILSSVVLASLNTSRQKSRDARIVADMGQMQLALELFFDSCQQYPQPSSGALLTTAANGCPSGTTLANFLSTIPTTPLGVAYTYAVNASPATDYVIMAPLEDGGHVVLDSDVDGTVFTVACGTSGSETAYCVSP